MPDSNVVPYSIPSAVLFDHDGVLVASEPLHWEAWGLLLGEIGLPYEEAEIRSLVGKTAPEILEQVLNHHRPSWKSDPPNQWDLQALAQRKNDHYTALIPKRLKTYPGVKELLEQLHAKNIPCACVSNARKRELELALQITQLYPYFKTIISRDENRPPKPHPGLYLLAAERLNVKPETAWIIEDSPTGAQAGLTGGFQVAVVLTNFKASDFDQLEPHPPHWIGETLEHWAHSLSGK